MVAQGLFGRGGGNFGNNFMPFNVPLPQGIPDDVSQQLAMQQLFAQQQAQKLQRKPWGNAALGLLLGGIPGAIGAYGIARNQRRNQLGALNEAYRDSMLKTLQGFGEATKVAMPYNETADFVRQQQAAKDAGQLVPGVQISNANAPMSTAYLQNSLEDQLGPIAGLVALNKYNQQQQMGYDAGLSNFGNPLAGNVPTIPTATTPKKQPQKMGDLSLAGDWQAAPSEPKTLQASVSQQAPTYTSDDLKNMPMFMSPQMLGQFLQAATSGGNAGLSAGQKSYEFGQMFPLKQQESNAEVANKNASTAYYNAQTEGKKIQNRYLPAKEQADIAAKNRSNRGSAGSELYQALQRGNITKEQYVNKILGGSAGEPSKNAMKDLQYVDTQLGKLREPQWFSSEAEKTAYQVQTKKLSDIRDNALRILQGESEAPAQGSKPVPQGGQGYKTTTGKTLTLPWVK